jgi:hypothetical protein
MQHNSIKILDEIIISQRLYYDRSMIEYNQMQTNKGSSSKTTKHEAEQSTYAEIVRGTQEENHIGTRPPRRFRAQNHQLTTSQEEEGFRRETSLRRSPTSRYYFSWFVIFL